LRWWLTIPAVAAVATYFWFKSLFVSAPTEAELRQAVKAKQRRIRRELRGLPPE
jgi:hypothetical protein